MKKSVLFITILLVLFTTVQARTIFFFENGQFSTFGASAGKSFSACNPCTFKLYVFAHDQPYSEVILQFKVTQGQTTECGCVMHDCFFMTKCGSLHSDCQSEGWWGYVPECNPCGNCGNIVRPDRQSCVGCGRYVGVYPSNVYLESDNSDLAEWTKNGSESGDVIVQTKNFAGDVNYLCPPSSEQCIMTLTAGSSDNIGGVNSFEVISEQFATTTTTTPITTTTYNPCPQGICGLNCPYGYADACGCSCNPTPEKDWKTLLSIIIIVIIFVMVLWLLNTKNY